jgi:hypothetical protein
MPRETIYRSTVQDSPYQALTIGWYTADQGGSVTVGIRETGKSEESPDNGVFTDLTRDQINKTIKVLRRARDSAYGRDE